MDNVATHKAPVWGSRANFIIRADLSSHGLPGRFEQLWARKIGPTTFELCCVPFFAYGLALGDKVESNADFTIQKIVEKDGHKALRVAVAIDEELERLRDAARVGSPHRAPLRMAFGRLSGSGFASGG